jgi:hypothetical protein
MSPKRTFSSPSRLCSTVVNPAAADPTQLERSNEAKGVGRLVVGAAGREETYTWSLESGVWSEGVVVRRGRLQ